MLTINTVMLMSEVPLSAISWRLQLWHIYDRSETVVCDRMHAFDGISEAVAP